MMLHYSSDRVGRSLGKVLVIVDLARPFRSPIDGAGIGLLRVGVELLSKDAPLPLETRHFEVVEKNKKIRDKIEAPVEVGAPDFSLEVVLEVVLPPFPFFHKMCMKGGRPSESHWSSCGRSMPSNSGQNCVTSETRPNMAQSRRKAVHTSMRLASFHLLKSALLEIIECICGSEVCPHQIPLPPSSFRALAASWCHRPFIFNVVLSQCCPLDGAQCNP
mmetsp:Transcript_42077/g.127631  ORF Transcript_42077/g.127631 Transcript_42077/m.127631 type:complete len:218 (-) Transcript_42077:65-718(-)